MQSSCKFFQWADETNTNTSYGGDDDGGGDGGGNWGNRGGGDWGPSTSARGRGRGGGGGGATRKPRAPGAKRKCGVCGTEGTIIRKNPNRFNSLHIIQSKNRIN